MSLLKRLDLARTYTVQTSDGGDPWVFWCIDPPVGLTFEEHRVGIASAMLAAVNHLRQEIEQSLLPIELVEFPQSMLAPLMINLNCRAEIAAGALVSAVLASLPGFADHSYAFWKLRVDLTMPPNEAAISLRLRPKQCVRLIVSRDHATTVHEEEEVDARVV